MLMGVWTIQQRLCAVVCGCDSLGAGDATYLYNTGNRLVAEAVDEAVSSAPPLALPNKAATIVWI
jgi:hypothetical protein